jgi:hypothetical protein
VAKINSPIGIQPAIISSQNDESFKIQSMRPLTYRPNDSNNRFRSRRFRVFQKIVDEVLRDKQVCRILDVGGTPSYWEIFGGNLNWKRLDVTVANLAVFEANHPQIKSLVGDARDMSKFENLSFDIVHSNSVIEHVGRWCDMESMASEVRRLAPRYFIQTPYFWFPVEPHARFPLLHWMPESWRYRILMKRTCGFWQQQPDLGRAVKAIQSATLLDRRQVKFLFPDAEIVSEKVFGLTKSLIAIR